MKATDATLGVVRESLLSIQIAQGIIEAVVQAGIPRAQLLAAAGLDRTVLEHPDGYLARSAVNRLCEVAIELTRDPALGLHWSERLRASTFNPLSHLITHADSLRRAFEAMFEFHGLLSDARRFQLLESGNEATVHCATLSGESGWTQRFSTEMLVAGVFHIIRLFVPDARPIRVSFEYPAPEYHPEYARVFDRTAHFDQPFTGIVFERALLDVVSPHRDADVHDALRTIAQRRMYRLTQLEPIASRVRERIVKRGPRARTDMNAVAQSLGLSARSLRRRLAAEDQSYNALVNEARGIVARHMVRNQQLSIQEAAFEMGFAETTAFHRAFKRWTGMTPADCREELPLS